MMEAILAGLEGQVSTVGVALMTLTQLVFWSIAFELAEPVLCAAMSIFPFLARYRDLKTQLGKSVWSEIAMSSMVALHHCISAALVVIGSARYGGAAGAGLVRWGLTSEVAFRTNDMMLAALGQRRHAGSQWRVRGLVVAHNLITSVVLLAAVGDFAEDWDVQRICSVVLGSGAGLASLVPTQYVFNLMTQRGFKAVFFLQVSTFLAFFWSRFVWGMRPRSGVYYRVISRIYSSAPAAAPVFLIGLGATWVYSGFVVMLLFGRLQRSRFSPKKVKTIREWFKKNQADAPEDKIQNHLWTSQKLSESLFASPCDMLIARVKVGPLCCKRCARRKAA